MKLAKLLSGSVAALSLLVVSAQVSRADIIPYPNIGTVNATTYTFTAVSTGNVMAYFAGASAGYTEEIGLLVNGVSTGIFGLNNHTSTVGQSLDLGFVHAGDTLTFVDKILTTGGSWYSNPALNSDGINHVYSTPYSGVLFDHSIPSGIYVGFEDLPLGKSDLDYNDVTFVFTDVSTGGGTPEPSFLSLLCAGFVGLGVVAYRRRRSA